MQRKKVLFILTQSMGWRTYGRSIKAIASRRDDIEAHFLMIERGWSEGLLTYNFSFSGKRLRRVLDPIVYWRWRLGRWWRQTGRAQGFDTLHIATQLQGLAFAELDPPISYSLNIDVTRKLVLANGYWPDDASREAIAREKRIFDRAAAIASMSSWAARSLVDEYGVAKDKIHVVPPSIIVPSPPHRPAKSNGLVNIGFVGDDFIRKGGLTLLRLHQGKFRERVRLHIVSKRFKPPAGLVNVVHHKHIPNARILDDFFRHMDIFCLPTEWDMSSWVTVEASAAGLPVVVCGVGGIPDLCRDGETGFLLPRGDVAALDRALSRLVADPALRIHLGQAGYRYIRDHFSAESNYNRLIDIIITVC